MNKRIIIILSVIIVILLAVAVILFCLSSPFSDKTKNSSENAQPLTSLSTSIKTATTQTTRNEKIDSYAPYKRIWYGDLEGMLLALDVQNVSDGSLTGELSIEGGEVKADVISKIQCNFMNNSFYGEEAIEILGQSLDIDIQFCNKELLILKFIKGGMSLNCVMK